MHSAIFTVADVTKHVDDMDGYLAGIEQPDAETLYEMLSSHADYVQEDAAGWQFDDLLHFLTRMEFVDVLDREEGLFRFSGNPAFIQTAIQGKLQEAEALLDGFVPSLQFYTVQQKINDTNGFYVATASPDCPLELRTFDEFLYDGSSVGRTYQLLYVNDYHF